MNAHPILLSLVLALSAPVASLAQTNSPAVKPGAAAGSSVVDPSDPNYEAKRAKAIKNLKSRAAYDKNRDGKLDDEERTRLSEDARKVVQSRFDTPSAYQETYRKEMDRNGDGKLDEEERNAAAAKYEKDLLDSWASFERQFPDLVP